MQLNRLTVFLLQGNFLYSFMFSHFWAVSGPFSEAWVATLCPDRGAIITDNNAIRFSENQNHQDFVTKQHYKQCLLNIHATFHYFF